MAGESGDRRTSAEPAVAGPRPLVSPRVWERAVLGMLLAGLTVEQISRLADLRVRVVRGEHADDGAAWSPDPTTTRRLEFARWLVQTGRLRET